MRDRETTTEEEAASKEEGWPEDAGELILLSPEIALGRKKICRGRNGKEGNFLGFFVLYTRVVERIGFGSDSDQKSDQIDLNSVKTDEKSVNLLKIRRV